MNKRINMGHPQKNEGKRVNEISRRKFLSGAATTLAAFTIVPGYVLGGKGKIPPSDKLNIAGIGAGGKGYGDLLMVREGSNIVAICDVNENYVI